jgi:hypothetical protein
MAGKSDVSLIFSGIPGVTATGVQITYAVGAVPTAVIDFAPAAPGVIKITDSSVLANVEQLKRNEMSVSVKVRARAGTGQTSTRTLSFRGLFDGLSMSNLIGGNQYQAILKNRAQVLLELTTMTPGLLPASTNVYKIAAFNTVEEEDGTVEKFFDASVDIKQGSPIAYYTELLRWIVKNQLNGFSAYVGTDDTLPDGTKPFEKIFKDKRYVNSLKNAQQILSQIDLTAVTGGVADQGSTNDAYIQDMIKDIFVSGPNNILESYLNFLNNFGCTLIFSNSKIFVVPANSVLKPDATGVGYRQMQSTPNKAGPADYNNYSYSDVGYKDVSSVIVVPNDYIGGNDKGAPIHDRGLLAQFTDSTTISKSGSVLIIPEHVWCRYSPISSTPADSVNTRNKLDSNESVYAKPVNIESSDIAVKEALAKAADEKMKKYNQIVGKVAQNYAEIRLYQEKYKDRTGSMLMDFNPQWVPGTSGTLYIRETGATIAFFVTQVSHSINMSAPNAGSAVTSVTFCCGRIGQTPPGVAKYLYLGFDNGKQSKVQAKFISDNS